MTRSPQRILLVGAGGFGREWWAPVRGSGAVVAGLVDPDHEALSTACAELDVPRERCREEVGDWREWDADTVIDSSPPTFRREHVLGALDAGLDVLVAKPMALTLADGHAMVAAANRAGKRLAVAQQKRLHPGFLALRRLVHDHELGELGVVNVDLNVDGRLWDPGVAWRLAMDHPLLLEGSVHHFDLMRWVLGVEPIAVYALSFNPPWSPFAGDACVSALVETDAGLNVNYRASWAPSGSSTVSFFSGWRLEFQRGCAELLDGEVWLNGRALGVLRGRPNPTLAELNGGILRRFFASIDGGGEPFCSGRDNLASLAMVEAALASIVTRRRIEIDGISDGIAVHA
jgi:predicted dehydrogenase